MKEFNKLIQSRFDVMCKTGKLFRSSMSGQEVWDLYISSFDTEHNPVFRDPNSSYHNCNNCKNFIRRYGNIVAIDDELNIMTMFDVVAPVEFKRVSIALSVTLKRSTISNIFTETFDELNKLPYEKCTKKNLVFKLGIDHNTKIYNEDEASKYGVVKVGETREFNHLHLYLPKEFVDTSGNSPEYLMAPYRDSKNVFKRAMDEIPLDTLLLVRDLINQESLLDGKTHLNKLETFIKLKTAYDTIPVNKRDNWYWFSSYKLPIARFRNELIGSLCTELAEGKELNAACLSWNKKVDPSNYMKATAPITKKQLNDQKMYIEENGFADSFDRRLATIDDIKVSEIKHINIGDGKVKNVSIFDNVKVTSTRHKRSEFDGVEEVHIDKFMSDILPHCTSIEAFLSNKLDGNMVSLTTTNKKDSKPIFKWDNNYSWTFSGNLAGKSMIKDAVEMKGGKVDGVLRFSIMWGENDPSDNSDLDAWAMEPGGNTIGYSRGFRKDSGNLRTKMSGQLDVDITQPSGFNNKNIVENIAWTDLKKMADGTYKLWVNQYSDRGSKGFKAEIEFDGEIFQYTYDRKVVGNVPVAEVTLNKGVFTIKHILPETSVSSRELYGLQTNEFHKVNLVCLSPNHWDGNNVGNKYFLFMLQGCKSPDSVRGFHNENLIPELLKNRNVMEALGASMLIPSTEPQLSGVGFNATVRDELVVRLQGSFKRVVKIKF